MSDSGLNQTAVIVVAVVVPVVTLLSLVACLYLCLHRQRSNLFLHRQRSNLFRLSRGASPINDEEIESWKSQRTEEKEAVPPYDPSYHHRSKSSTTSILKPASVIIYQDSIRPSEDGSPRSTRSSHGHSLSGDGLARPLLARAPNSRPGLTDEMVRGDDAFIPPPKRQQSRLAKSNPTSPRTPQSARSSISMSAMRDQWYGQGVDYQLLARQSVDNVAKSPSATRMLGHHRVYSSPDCPPQRRFDDLAPGGLTPRPPLHSSEIGRAIG